jgi:HlyD family secretion protein
MTRILSIQRGELMKRKWTVLLILVVVGSVTAGAYLRFFAQPAAAASNANLSTATVQRGTLVASASAAGNVSAAQAVTLNFLQSGPVDKVNVQVGDAVKAGQVLATLDTRNLTLQLQTAQVSLKDAQDKLVQAKNPSTSQDIASAQAALAAAQANYDKLVAGATSSDIAAAQAAVVSAQAAYAAAQKNAGTGDAQLAADAAAVDKAKAAVDAAQQAYDKVKNSPNIGMLPQSVTLQQATIDYQTALAAYSQLAATSATSANSTVQAAKAQVQQAQANLAKLQNQVTQNDVIASKAQVTQAQNALDKLKAGSDAPTLDEAQNAVDQANIAVKQAQLALDQSQIVAPFDGVITAVNVTAGGGSAGINGSSSTSGAIQMADLANLQVVANLAEVDVTRIRVGQDVQVALDALPNVNLQGKVIQISPAGTLTQGVVNYPVTIQLTSPGQAVKTGMTANLTIIVQQHDNVLMVPNRAVRVAARQGGANQGGAANRGNAAGSNGTGGANATGASGNNAGGAQNRGGNGARNSGGTGGQGGGAGGARNGNATGGQGGNGTGGQRGSGTGGQRSRPAYVTVLTNGQQVQVPVQIGLANDTMTEIVSGLNEGDVVVMNGTTTAQPRTGGGLAIPGGRGFGG